MSSTYKTENLGLNNWIGSDTPEMEDFNRDNDLIETAVSQHTSDETSHITEVERNKWNNYIYTYTYPGNGNTSRTVDAQCPFDAEFCIVFTDGRSIKDTGSSSQSRNNFGVAVKGSYTLGLRLNQDNTLTVSQSSTAAYSNEFACFNALNSVYVAVFFRSV